jgi:hypothetical protein
MEGEIQQLERKFKVRLVALHFAWIIPTGLECHVLDERKGE